MSRTRITAQQWLAAAEQEGWAEVVAGRLVSSEREYAARVGGNADHIVANRIAQCFREQWGAVASATGSWLLAGESDDVHEARIADVLVDGPQLDTLGPYRGRPLAVAEVWSPGNTLADMTAKRHAYHRAGAEVFLEAWISDDGDVNLQWYVPLLRPGAWRLVAAAAGDEPLDALVPRPFHRVPNRLRG